MCQSFRTPVFVHFPKRLMQIPALVPSAYSTDLHFLILFPDDTAGMFGMACPGRLFMFPLFTASSLGFRRDVGIVRVLDKLVFFICIRTG